MLMTWRNEADFIVIVNLLLAGLLYMLWYFTVYIYTTVSEKLIALSIQSNEN